MTTTELTNQGAIFFERITEGLNKYKDVKIKLDEKKALSHFKNLIKEYGSEKAFADFYYFRLDEDAKEMIQEALTPGEVSYLSLLKPMEDDAEEEIIFPLDEQLLKIIVKLNSQEILFSTIYFLDAADGGRKRSTWWANYEQEYICFTDKKEE